MAERNRKGLWFDLDKPDQRQAYEILIGLSGSSGRLDMSKISAEVIRLYNSPTEQQGLTVRDLEALEKRLIKKLDSISVVASAPAGGSERKEEEEEFNADDIPDFLMDLL